MLDFKLVKLAVLLLSVVDAPPTTSAPTFEVKSTQSFYQAEEKQNVTMEWTFPPPADGSLTSLHATCLKVTDVKFSVLLELIGGIQFSESEDEQFAGRVHCDTDVLKEGRLRLHVSSLRTEDSGTYMCEMIIDDGRGRGESLLNVGAAHEPEPQIPTVRPESQGRPGLYTELRLVLVLVLGLGLGLVILAVVLALSVFKKCVIKSAEERGNISAVV